MIEDTMIHMNTTEGQTDEKYEHLLLVLDTLEGKHDSAILISIRNDLELHLLI